MNSICNLYKYFRQEFVHVVYLTVLNLYGTVNVSRYEHIGNSPLLHIFNIFIMTKGCCCSVVVIGC